MMLMDNLLAKQWYTDEKYDDGEDEQTYMLLMVVDDELMG